MRSTSRLILVPFCHAPMVVTARVCGIIRTENVSPCTSLTVNETPSSATDPFCAMNFEIANGARIANRAISVRSCRSIISTTLSVWAATMWPPNSSPILSDRSRLMREPACHVPTVVTASVSAAASTENHARSQRPRPRPSCTPHCTQSRHHQRWLRDHSCTRS